MANLEDVLRDFDRRLKVLESQLTGLSSSRAPTMDHPSPSPSPAPSDTAPGPLRAPVSAEVTPDTYQPPRRAASGGSQEFDSSSVLATIGILFVILAGVFFIKITIDSGWLTPMRQILIAAGMGLGFFLVPQFFPKAEREYGALLAGAGTTILHLTWLGAYFYHHILDANAALVCATLVGAFSILANFDNGNRVYVLVAMAGTYLSAPIVGYNTGELGVLSIFLMIWNISFSMASIVSKRRDIVFIASYFAVFTVLLLSGKARGVDQQTELLLLQVAQFLVFSFSMVSYSIFHRSPLSSDESLSILPLLLLFYASTGHLVSAISPGFAPWFGLAIGGFVLALYLAAKRFLQSDLESGPSLTAFAAIAFVHSFYFQLLDELLQPLAALLIGVLVFTVWSQSAGARKNFLWPLMILASTFVYGAILTVVSVRSIESMYLYNWAYGIVALIGVFALGSKSETKEKATRYAPLVLGFAHLEVMLGLYRFSQQVAWSGALFVTFSWGLYAVLVLAVAYWRKDKVLGHSALTILLAVSLKAFFYDVINTSNLIRVVCLLAEGLLLYCCGWIFKRMQEWKD